MSLRLFPYCRELAPRAWGAAGLAGSRALPGSQSAIFFGDEAVWGLRAFLKGQLRSLSTFSNPFCFPSPTGAELRRASAWKETTPLLSSGSLLCTYRASSVQRKGLELNDEEGQRAGGGRSCAWSPHDRLRSGAAPGLKGRPGPGRHQPAARRAPRSSARLDSAATRAPRGGRHTHSCMERLQYSMWRGAPFRLNCSTV